MPRRVLSVSYDPVLLKTREMILEQQGYTVCSVQTAFADRALDAHKPEQMIAELARIFRDGG